jgi:tetratricopeptide (TPR) repeat protein
VRVISSYDSVRLFSERVKAVRSNFEVTAENADSVVDICSQLEGNALAIELAAARVGTMTPHKLSERLRDHHLELLKGHSGSSNHKHSVRGTLDWSYELLGHEEQVLLQRLSIFAGGWSLEAAESVASGDGIEVNSVADLLGSLVEKSLVVFESDVDRYRFLETVRQYAAEKMLASGVRGFLLANLRRWSEEFVTAHEIAPVGPEQANWATQIRTELPNLRVALESCSEDHKAGLAIGRRLGRFFVYAGPHEEGLALLVDALRRDGAQDPTPDRAHALFAAATIAMEGRNWNIAKDFLQQSETLFESFKDLEGLAWTLDAQASLSSWSGNQDQAKGYYERALELARARGDKAQLATSLYNYSVLLVNVGDPEAFRDAAQESMQLHKELGGTLVIAWQLRVLALYDWWTGNWDAAWMKFQEGIDLLEGRDDFLNKGYMLEFAARFSREISDLARAERLVEEAKQAFSAMDFDPGFAIAQWNLCSIRLDEGRIDEALEIATPLMSTKSWIADRRQLARAKEELGAIAIARGDLPGALTELQEGLALCLEDNYLRAIPLYLERLAVHAYVIGEYVQAAGLLGATDASRAKIRLAIPPYRSKFLEPVVQALVAKLGPDTFETAKAAGRDLELRQVVSRPRRSEEPLAAR